MTVSLRQTLVTHTVLTGCELKRRLEWFPIRSLSSENANVALPLQKKSHQVATRMTSSKLRREKFNSFDLLPLFCLFVCLFELARRLSRTATPANIFMF